MERDGVKKMMMLTADAVEFGQRLLDLSFVISSQVCVTNVSLLTRD